MSGRRQTSLDVVFLTPTLGPAIAPGPEARPGGSETQVLMLARLLVQRGYRVGIVTWDTAAGLPAEVDGVRLRVLRRPRLRLRGVRGLAHVGAVAWAIAAARGRVIVQQGAAAETGVAALVARVLGRRFVFSAANVMDFDYGMLEPSTRNLRMYHLGVRLASEVVVQTAEQVEMCRATFGRSPRPIPSIGAAAEPAGSPEAFLWVGRLIHYKRPQDFLRLAEALPDARFRMVGVPSEPATERGLRERAAELGNVEWLDPLPREEVLELMGSAVAVVNTSDYEGMPNVFLEGWARGVPALTLNHDPDGIIERHRIGAAAFGDFHRFVAAARELWDSRTDANGSADRCRAYVAARHDPEAVAGQWIDALGIGPSGVE